ncbi:hypothetical protein V7056_19590 [Bacillus sp. JJ664]
MLAFTIYNWNDLSVHNMIISQILLSSMFIFGGIDHILSENKTLKIMGVAYFGVAIFAAFVAFTKLYIGM